MATLFIVLGGFFGFIAAAAAILLGVTLGEYQKQRHPWLARLDSKKVQLIAAAIVFSALTYGTSVLKDVLASRSEIRRNT